MRAKPLAVTRVGSAAREAVGSDARLKYLTPGGDGGGRQSGP
jgi:hypothetical protein